MASIARDGLDFDKIYPIGSIYISVNSTNPHDLFGGTWEQLKDRFLLGAGGSYTLGNTGGEASHTLTVAEMPEHKHVFSNITPGGNTAKYEQWRNTGVTNSNAQRTPSGSTFNGAETEPTGGNQAHNNMPPYLAVYMWKRIS